MSAIALFGATGNIGKELVPILKREEQQFLLFTRGDPALVEKKLRLDPGGNIRVVSLPKETDAVADVLSSHGVKTVFACLPQLMVHRAEEWAQDLVPSLKKAGVVRVVKIGTSNAEKYEYGRRHIASEKVFRDSGLKLTVLRGGEFSSNPNWQGPAPPGAPYFLIDLFKLLAWLSYVGLSIFKTMGNCAGMMGNAKEPFLDLRDFAEAISVVLLNASSHEGETYTIYSDSVSMEEVASTYGKLLGRRIKVMELNDNEIRELVALDGFTGEMGDLLVDMFAQFKKRVNQADPSWDGFTKLTGKKPRSFEDYAKEQVDSQWKPPMLW